MVEKYFIRRSNAAFKKAFGKGKITFGFIGGSITDPRPRVRWPEYLIMDFMAAYPEIAVNVENAAVGATGSNHAVFRAEQDLVSRGCDIIFVEYAVNDEGEPTELRNESREGLLRKLAKSGKTDIVITYTYSHTMLPYFEEGTLPPTIAEFEQLAEHYDFSSVFMSRYAFDEMKKGTVRFQEWIPDKLHPAGIGSRLYARAVLDFLKDLLQEESTGGEYVLPEPLYGGNWGNAYALPLDQIVRKGPWKLERLMELHFAEYALTSCVPGSGLEIPFTGTGLVICHPYGNLAADFRWRLDGGAWKEEREERADWMADFNFPKVNVLAHGIEKRPHMLEIEVLYPGDDPRQTDNIFMLTIAGVLTD